MSHVQMSRTKVVAEVWQGLTAEENDAKTVEIYDVIGKHGGDVKVVGFLPSDTSLVSVIEYPDDVSAKRSVAEILALGSLEFVSIENIWDVGEWVAMVREANA